LRANNVDLAITLLEDDNLNPVWQRHDLIPSVVAYVATHTLGTGHQTSDTMSIETGRTVLKSLQRRFSTAACERGLAQTTKSIEDMTRLSPLVEGILTLVSTAGNELDTNVLPPRVALEHPDVEVRRRALALITGNDNTMANGYEDIDGGETLMETLVRRWSVEPDRALSREFARAIVDSEFSLITKQRADRQCLGVLNGAYHWLDSKSMSDLLPAVVDKAVKDSKEIGEKSDAVQYLREVSVSLVKTSKVTESTQVSEALGDSRFLERLVENSRKSGAGHEKRQLILERVGWNLLIALQNRKDLDVPLAKLYLQIFVQSIKSGKLRHTSHLELAKISLQTVAKAFSNSPTTVVESLVILSSVSGKDLFSLVDDLLQTLSASVTDISTGKVNPLAVVMEAALRTTASFSCKRLVNFAVDIAEKRAAPVWVVVVPCLVLLGHQDKGVREATVSLLSAASRTSGKHKINGVLSTQSIFHLLLDNKTSVAQVGISLPSFFSRLKSHVNFLDIRDAFLEMTLRSALTVATKDSTRASAVVDHACWLRFDEKSSTREAACKILEAMETAGEATFPLLLRWEKVGFPLLKWYGQSTKTEFPSKATQVSEILAKQLKGIVLQEPNIVLSSGTNSHGARRRSYSIGHADDLEVLSPYPKDMVESIIASIQARDALYDEVVDTVISSKSWGDLVFPKLESNAKKQIIKTLLVSSISDHAGALMPIARKLSLTAFETADIVKHVSSTEDAFPYLALLFDYISANVSHLLANNDDLTPLVSQLFTTLEDLCKLHSFNDPDGLSFLLQALLTAIDKSLAREPENLSWEQLQKWIQPLLSTLGASGKPGTGTWKIRSLSLGILTSMSKFKYNKIIVASLADHTLNLASRINTSSTDDFCAVMSVSVPLLWSSRDSPQSPISFLAELFSRIAKQGKEICNTIVQNLLKVMSNTPSVDEVSQHVFPGIIASIIVALKKVAFSNEAAIQMANDVIESSPASSQLLSISYLVEICKTILGRILGSQTDNEMSREKLPAQSDIIAMVSHPVGKETDSKSSSLSFAVSTLSIVNQHVVIDQVQKVLSQRNALVAAASLQLWQNLLLIHATAEDASESPDEQELGSLNSWKIIATLGEEGCESVQKAIPASVLVASVESLLNECVADDLRSRALQLAAEQVLVMQPQDENQAPFSRLLTTVTSLILDHAENVRVRQSALVYVDYAVRALFRPKSVDFGNGQPLMQALSACANAAKALKSLIDELQSIDMNTWNLLSSLALASSTLVDVLGVNAMRSLAPLLKTFLAVLSQTNKEVMASNSGKDQLGRVQLATIAFFHATTKAVPQSIFGQLRTLLSPSVLFARSLRQTNNAATIALIKKLDDRIATQIPARLLIPVLVKVITGLGTEDDNGPETMLYALGILSMTVATLGPGEGGIFRSAVTNALLKAFQCQCTLERKQQLVSKGIECMIGFVLKLSEVQFLRMYGDLSEWMSQDPDSRRYAFWSLSEALSRELKTIFLPCASIVVDEIVSDLGCFADFLSRKGAVEVVQEGKKKRKKAIENVVQMGDESLRSLVPLLGLTSTFLTADAQSGGNWTRERGRYHDILNPLAKLLHCQVPEGFPLPKSSVTSFEYIVEENDRGSVVDCLTALALAAGDEQLWKPMNHAVLEACGHATRSQVRKGALVCLLSLIQSLGEEYMVLLPECLPVLAELLEDENEIIAGLARHTISTAEELLGESLENNLK
jgi:U3 small nucleolar RNA-associated protein 10